ncbi:hypothetical protein C8R45DRAFT_1136707 [Mycena sanguinolenta]|nr:hypothetical protein C8R45DRAFT_1136707 [Mycena sanguinolenta]
MTFYICVVNMSELEALLVASLALLAYDILRTFDEEVAVIWPRPWTAIKCLFFFIRYFPLLLQISLLFVGTDITPRFNFTFRDCEVWAIYQSAAAVILLAAVDYILILRVFALYDNHRYIKAPVLILFCLELLVMLVSLGFSLSGIRFDDERRCIVTHFPNPFILYGASAVLFQTVLFSLTVLRFAHAIRAGWGKMPLLLLIVRDGTWAYLLAVLIVIRDLSLYTLKNHAYGGILYGWMVTAFSFSGYRILLNLGASLHRDTLPLTAINGPMRFGWEMDPESVAVPSSSGATPRAESVAAPVEPVVAGPSGWGAQRANRNGDDIEMELQAERTSAYSISMSEKSHFACHGLKGLIWFKLSVAGHLSRVTSRCNPPQSLIRSNPGFATLKVKIASVIMPPSSTPGDERSNNSGCMGQDDALKYTTV